MSQSVNPSTNQPIIVITQVINLNSPLVLRHRVLDTPQLNSAQLSSPEAVEQIRCRSCDEEEQDVGPWTGSALLHCLHRQKNNNIYTLRRIPHILVL